MSLSLFGCRESEGIENEIQIWATFPLFYVLGFLMISYFPEFRFFSLVYLLALTLCLVAGNRRNWERNTSLKYFCLLLLLSVSIRVLTRTTTCVTLGVVSHFVRSLRYLKISSFYDFRFFSVVYVQPNGSFADFFGFSFTFCKPNIIFTWSLVLLFRLGESILLFRLFLLYHFYFTASQFWYAVEGEFEIRISLLLFWVI